MGGVQSFAGGEKAGAVLSAFINLDPCVLLSSPLGSRCHGESAAQKRVEGFVRGCTPRVVMVWQGGWLHDRI